MSSASALSPPSTSPTFTSIAAPMSLLAELTHRCPLACPYCSNPLDLERRSAELPREIWERVLEEAAELGVLQVHFSGGEPMSRPDLSALVEKARSVGLYTNLITSGLMLTEDTLRKLDEAGLDHIQLSFQDVVPEEADLLAGVKNVQPRKLEAARLIMQSDIPLTLNFVLQRRNMERMPAMFHLARQLGVHRVEMACAQYYGWALKNRPALLPTRAQLDQAAACVAEEEKKGGLAIDFVTPDYYADRPKPCMGGWGRRFLNVSPSGRVLPCHAAETIPNVAFPNVRGASLREIWYDSELFNKFRGIDWMPRPCSSCDRREQDWGGCRCQALALTGNAANTDPVCSLSPFHDRVVKALEEANAPAPPFIYRRFSS
ncbi:pyrroloquinoline quinone biosynthesis protein PqqE [Oecophyllibacter saccharovorans]|uniref:PqqA peptide cyclase n=1 Tax=Oecophyllibacter saccharovorans TaxID=2558360 RepID=A0A506UKS8_9PROT|nr:pyrroloquinoline quinone biosynthesis protein PqqE [Oecophyllibacter saccharovorans]TPW33949.1 pyrroloquinoline quinone biosynthesis protein PqqE [Oecophyllibacter saccharovorans]